MSNDAMERPTSDDPISSFGLRLSLYLSLFVAKCYLPDDESHAYVITICQTQIQRDVLNQL
jgi:hypothetical protein